ncbi:MAG TPA: autorepressor SdpR family transcription factor [Gemmatimonadales bacterium]|jgi:DNA-binding transcriptional ArsR family regulator|nr:autorepressor SdpR family transcription factor [Gemmatimonadales bacterium]
MMLDRTFRALADPTRRQILALLRSEDRAAGDLAAHFDMTFASVSHHLQVLRDADLVLTRRDGQRVIYSLNTTVFQDALQHLLDIAPGPGARKSRRRSEGKSDA